MFPYSYPATIESPMQFVQNNGNFPPAFVSLFAEPSTRSYAGECVHNDSTFKDSAKGHHYDDLNSINRGYYLNDPTMLSEFHLYEPIISAGRYTHKVMGKEERLDEILSNANKWTKSRVKSDNATAAALDLRRNYRRCPKRKKFKSFMVRDLIDLPADEKHSGVSDAKCQYQSMPPRTELTPPPEAEISWKKYDFYFPEYQKPCDSTTNDKSHQLYQMALRTYASSGNIVEPSLPDSSKCCDSEESRLDPIYRYPTSSSDTSVTCDLNPSTRIPTPSPDSQGSNSDPCSGGSVTSPCGKAKRIRTIFSCSQLQRLEIEFERSHYMVGSERSRLAEELNLTESQVKVWFQNRRIKYRKHFHEQQQAILSKLKSEENDCKTEEENFTNEDNILSSTCSGESSS